MLFLSRIALAAIAIANRRRSRAGLVVPVMTAAMTAAALAIILSMR
jgi:hypothetical protein